MSGHLEDEILDGLRSAPSEAWERLHTLVEHLEVDDLASPWRGGPASAGPDGIYQMPYVSWSDPLTTLVDTLYEVKAIAVIDWSTWASSYPFGDIPEARAANVMEAVCWVTAVVRADRFDEGVLKEAVDDGTFVTLVQRVLAWNLADRRRAPKAVVASRAERRILATLDDALRALPAFADEPDRRARAKEAATSVLELAGTRSPTFYVTTGGNYVGVLHDDGERVMRIQGREVRSRFQAVGFIARRPTPGRRLPDENLPFRLGL